MRLDNEVLLLEAQKTINEAAEKSVRQAIKISELDQKLITAQSQLAESQRECAKFREALRWYADFGNWFDCCDGECRGICRTDLSELTPNNFGGGLRAREALSPHPGESAKGKMMSKIHAVFGNRTFCDMRLDIPGKAIWWTKDTKQITCKKCLKKKPSEKKDKK